MSGVVVWVGPVSTRDIADYVPRGWTVHTYNRGTGGDIRSSSFRAWARSLGADPLTSLAGDADRVVIAAFSAGHGASEVLLARAAETNDARLCGYLGVDAYYADASDSPPKSGHLAWGTLAARDGRPMWLTTSTHPNQSRPSSTECIAPLAAALRLRPTRAPRDMPPPVRSFGRGGVAWLDYGNTFAHRDHARLLAPAALMAWPRDTRGRGSFTLPALALALLGFKLWRRL